MDRYLTEFYLKINKDKNLVQSLWKQNIDIGFSLEEARKEVDTGHKIGFERFAYEDSSDTLMSLSLKKKIKDDKIDKEKEEEDLWAGLDYTVDTETGEYIVNKIHNPATARSSNVEEFLNLPEYFIEEALSLVDNYDQTIQHSSNYSLPKTPNENELGSDLTEVVQSWQCHQAGQICSFLPKEQLKFSPPRPANTEQRWFEIPNMPSYSVHQTPSTRDNELMQKTLGHNLTSTTDSACLITMLTHEDLELMKMALNEGMYTMRSLDGQDPRSLTSPTNNTENYGERMDSNDSAVSSMGSEQVPNLRDVELYDAKSESECLSSGNKNHNRSLTHISPNGQNKQQIFGKRHIQMQMDQRQHDQLLNTQFKGGLHKSHDFEIKSKLRRSSQENLSRDEKRAKAMNIPITVDEIINLPMDEFNERISKSELAENQLSLIRDIRRRGKNKVAAQNCRKRKLDQILHLADEVKGMKDCKIELENNHVNAVTKVKRMKEKFQQLYRHVFRNLRDADGNPYSPYQYSLQTTADGTMVMVPKNTVKP